FVKAEGVAIQRGRVDLTATVGLMPQEGGEPEPTVAAEVVASDMAMTLAAINGRQVVADATLTGTTDGAQIHSLDARVGSTTIDATGYVGDWDDLVIDVGFDARAPQPEELLELLPEPDADLQAQIETVAVSGPLFVSGTMVGPAERANISAQIGAPGEVRYASADVGEIVAGPLDLRVDVLDLADVNVRARANIDRADPVDLEPLRASLPEEMEGPIEVAPLEDVTADFLWSADMPILQTDLALPRVAVGDLTVTDLRTGVAMADDVIYLRDLQAEPLGARLTADATIDLGAEDGLWAWADGSIEGLDLARLSELPGLDATEGLTGEFSGDFAAEYDDGTPYAIAQAVIERPRYDEYTAESLRAMVVLDEDAVEILGAGVQDAMGVAWVRGIVPFEGEMAASFAIPGVDLATVAERFDLDVDGLEGEVFLTGSAAGTTEQPQIDATVRAFNVEYQEYEVDALRADIEGGLDELEINDLFASSGRIVAGVDGTLRDIDLDEPNAQIAGTVRLAGPMDQAALELADLEGEDLVGTLNAEVDVAGTLQQPSADGTVYLEYARYDAVVTDDAVLRVSLEDDVLEMEELRVPIGDAVVFGSATMTSVFDDPILSATLRARDVVLQDMALWQEMGLPMSGTVNLPYLSLQGPLDNLSGLAQVDATDLMLGQEEIGGVSAMVVLDQETLMLRRTTIALAGGELAVEGSYRLTRQEIQPSEVEFDDVSISELLQAAVPIARYLEDGAVEEEPDGQSLAMQLTSLSLRLGGRLDGVLSVEGAIPEAATDDAPSEELVADLLDALSAEVDVDVREPSLDNKSLPDLRLAAQVADEPEVALQIEAAEGDALITADGTWRPDGSVEMLAEISAFDMAELRPWTPRMVEAVGGRLNLTVQATGTLDDPQFIASIDVLDPEAQGVKLDLISAPIIRYDGEFIDVDSLVLRESEEEFYVDGRIPLDWDTMSVPEDGELEVVLRSDGTDLAIFPPMIARAADASGRDDPLSRIEATGSLDSLVRVTGTPRRPELNGQISANATSIVTPWLDSPVEDLVLDADFTGVEGATVVDLEEFTARVESTTVEAGGAARMLEYDLANLDQNVYDLSLSVDASRQTIGSDGLTARDVRGEVSLETDEAGQHLLTMDDLGANFGDGSVVLDGTAQVRSFVPSEMDQNIFDLQLVADDARPRYGNFFVGTIDGTIDIVNAEPGTPVSIDGGMTLSHGVIGIPPIGGEEGAEGLVGMPADFPSPNLDIALGVGPDVRVRTTGLTAPLEPTEKAIWVRGTPQRPSVQGLVEVQEGEAQVSGGVLNVQTAGVRFLIRPKLGVQRQPPIDLELDGRVWATATRTIEETVVGGERLEDVLIEMEVSGTLPNHIHVQVSSVPPLAEEQIYALLGTAPFSGSGGLAAGGDLEDVMTEQFVSALGAAFRQYVFQPFEEDLKEMLGLSVFEVSFAFNQPVDVRLGGYIVEDLLITYETSVYGATTDEYELGVSYKVQRQFELTYQTDEDNDHRLLVEYVYQF
ncbi:MAG: translocation/assembly module TamB domain-containing protein, partial [Armatimonadota bacterium]